MEIINDLTKTCKFCESLGYLKDGTLCSCRIKLYDYVRYHESNIPKIYWDVSYKSFMTTNKQNNLFLQKLLAYPEKQLDKLNLGFFGSSQTGKSTTAAIIAKKFIDKSLLSIYWFNYSTLLYSLRRKFNDSAVDLMLDDALKADLVIIDDLGRDYALDKLFAKSEITRIFQEIFESRRSVIITSNFFVTDLEESFDIKFNSLISSNLRMIDFKMKEVT